MRPSTIRYFESYAADHRHPLNRLTHKIAIPVIVFHVLAMLAAVPVGTVGGVNVTLGLVGWAGASAFWLALLPRSGMLLALASLPAALWGGEVAMSALVVLAVVGWTIQLAGHVVWEKNRPSFPKNLGQALVGPLFFVAALLGELPRSKATAAPET